MLPFLAALPGIISAGTTFAGLLKSGSKKTGITPAEQKQSENAALSAGASRNISSLSRALIESDNPMMKRLQEEEANNLAMERQMSLRDLLNANRRSQLLGRGTIFDPERRDESINKWLTISNQQLPSQARQYAINRILGAITGYDRASSAASGAASAYRYIVPQELARRQESADKSASILGGIGNVAQLLPMLL